MYIVYYWYFIACNCCPTCPLCCALILLYPCICSLRSLCRRCSSACLDTNECGRRVENPSEWPIYIVEGCCRLVIIFYWSYHWFYYFVRSLNWFFDTFFQTKGWSYMYMYQRREKKVRNREVKWWSRDDSPGEVGVAPPDDCAVARLLLLSGCCGKTSPVWWDLSNWLPD